MVYSKYNIFSRIRDSENFFIINLLSGSADILSPEEADIVTQLRSGKEPAFDECVRELAAKGYLMDSDEEERLYRKRYLDFIDSRDNDEVQLFFVTNYSCNFACSYCYQDQYVNPKGELSIEVIDAFFSYVKDSFRDRRKYITVFGGEPLLSSPGQKQLITYLVNRANVENIELCFVTNGYTLDDYLPIIKNSKIREIQVTLDGIGDVHNKRRFLKGGGATFDRIVKGIDSCLENGIPVNLRMVTDRENISGLTDLAKFAIERGWTGNSFFKTQLGRNYELHHCQTSGEKLFDRISLYEKLYDLIKENPFIADFYKPAYSVAKFLSENGELPDPLFDSCPACKTEWAFDYTGTIYPCTATVGKNDEAIGTFHPDVRINSDLIGEWESRDVLSIQSCRDCSLQLACGGGCGSVSKNTNGKICSSDCRPVKELLELGISAYSNNEPTVL